MPVLNEFAMSVRTDWANQHSVFGELSRQRRRGSAFGHRRDGDGIERCGLRCTESSIPGVDFDVVVAGIAEIGACCLGQFGLAFDRDDLGATPRQDRGPITAAGTDFQDPFDVGQVQRRGHHGDDPRRGCRLSIADGYRLVLVRRASPLVRHELFTRNGSHGSKNAFVGDTGAS